MNKIIKLLTPVLLICTIFYSCKHTINDNTNLADQEASRHGSNKSRGMSGDCISCHKLRGSGEGVFTLGGTVFKPDLKTIQPNGYIKLYSGPQGTGVLLKTIEVDALGNFYSDANYNFTLPIYPAAVSAGGSVKYMGSSLSGGSCNSCHGVSTDVIHVN